VLILLFCFINVFQGSVCIVNAASNRDIEVFAAGMIQVMSSLLQIIEINSNINYL